MAALWKAECVQFIWLFIVTNANRSQNQNVKLTNYAQCTKGMGFASASMSVYNILFLQNCWLWFAFIGIFADTWKISSYQWSTCPGHWLSAPLLPPSLSLGFCLPSSGILWCSIMVSSILKKYSFFIFLVYAWINLKCYKNKSCLVLDAWCAMCCILSAHSEGQKLITANFFA